MFSALDPLRSDLSFLCRAFFFACAICVYKDVQAMFAEREPEVIFWIVGYLGHYKTVEVDRVGGDVLRLHSYLGFLRKTDST